MAFRVAEGTRVQAIDENGHWESGRVLKGYSDAALVSFNGYETEHDRIVPRSEIRAPVAYHETGEMVYLLIVPLLMSFSFLLRICLDREQVCLGCIARSFEYACRNFGHFRFAFSSSRPSKWTQSDLG